MEKYSKTDSKVDLSSIPDDMTIEEVLVEFFKASDVKESSDGTVSPFHCKSEEICSV